MHTLLLVNFCFYLIKGQFNHKIRYACFSPAVLFLPYQRLFECVLSSFGNFRYSDFCK